MEVITTISIDLTDPQIPNIIRAKQNDSNTRWVYISLTSGSALFYPEKGTIAVLRIRKRDGRALFYDSDENNNPAVIIDGNVVKCLLLEQALTTDGVALAEVNLYNLDGQRVTTFFFEIHVEKSALSDAEVISSEYFNVLTKQIATAVNAAESAAHAPEPKNGTWWIWDAETLAYIDTGQPTFEIGPAPTIKIGDTVTLPPGAEAFVTNAGTSTDAVFNFGIPQGERGEDGDGAISTINGIAPVNKNVTLQASDVGAISRPSTAKAGNIAIFDNNKNVVDGGALINLIYPVGSIHMSVNPANPSTYFGGTWIAWGAGRAPVGVAASGTFSSVENTGGAEVHTLSVEQMPLHTHGMTQGFAYAAGGTSACIGFSGATSYSTGGSGGGQAHNNLQPYITCYMWKRTA